MENASFRKENAFNSVADIVTQLHASFPEVSFDSKTAYDDIKSRPYVRNDEGGSETLFITEGSRQGNPLVCFAGWKTRQ